MPSGTSPTDPPCPSSQRLPGLPAGALVATPSDPWSTAAGWATRLVAAGDDARQVALTLLAARDGCLLGGPAGAALTELVQQVASAVRAVSGSCCATADELRAVAVRSAVRAAGPAPR